MRWPMLAVLAAAVVSLKAAPPLPVYAYELGKVSAEQQAALVAANHFAGTIFDGPTDLEERLRALDAHHLQLLALWLVPEVGLHTVQYPSGFEQAIRALRGRSTAIWLAIQKSREGCDPEQVIKAVRHAADLAGAEGLRVSLYPHSGFCLARFADVLRMAEAADRSNVGVVFNLCHELRAGWDGQWTFPAFETTRYLDAVTINGADAGSLSQESGWSRLIQPLGSGTFDTKRLLQTIYATGFRGPVAIQSYGLSNPERFLPASYQAWTEMHVE